MPASVKRPMPGGGEALGLQQISGLHSSQRTARRTNMGNSDLDLWRPRIPVMYCMCLNNFLFLFLCEHIESSS